MHASLFAWKDIIYLGGRQHFFDEIAYLGAYKHMYMCTKKKCACPYIFFLNWEYFLGYLVKIELLRVKSLRIFQVKGLNAKFIPFEIIMEWCNKFCCLNGLRGKMHWWKIEMLKMLLLPKYVTVLQIATPKQSVAKLTFCCNNSYLHNKISGNSQNPSFLKKALCHPADDLV